MIAKIPWALLALLHLTPALAVFRPASMNALYALPQDSALMPLMQHRAALFGCIVIAAVWAAFDPDVRKLSAVLIGVSMVSFLALYLAAGQPQNLRSIAIADLIGLPVLAWAAYTAFAGQG